MLVLFVKVPEHVATTADILREDAFGKSARYMALVVEDTAEPNSSTTTNNNSKIVGYSIYNETYSSLTGRIMWIVDLYIEESARGSGLAAGVLRKLASYAAREGIDRIQWNVLGWNRNAMEFYKSVGAEDITGMVDGNSSSGELDENGFNCYHWTEEQYRRYLDTPWPHENGSGQIVIE